MLSQDTIYDGLKRPLKNWTNHIVNILKRCQLVVRKADFKFTLETGSIFHQVFKLTFSSEVEGVEAEMRGRESVLVCKE